MSRAASLDRRTRWIMIGVLAVLFALALAWGASTDDSVSPATAACINDNGGVAVERSDGGWEVDDWADARALCGG